MSTSSVEFPIASPISLLRLWFRLDSTFKQLEDITESDGGGATVDWIGGWDETLEKEKHKAVQRNIFYSLVEWGQWEMFWNPSLNYGIQSFLGAQGESPLWPPTPRLPPAANIEWMDSNWIRVVLSIFRFVIGMKGISNRTGNN